MQDAALQKLNAIISGKTHPDEADKVMAELAFLADDPAFLGTLASQVPTMLKGALPAVGKFLWSKL